VGQDGDPLDVLILMDEPAFPGCLIPSKLIGVIEAEQTEDGNTFRNDRLIATATDSRNHSHVRFLGDLNENMVREIEHFFISYNESKGKRFEILRRSGPERAKAIVQAARSAGSRAHRQKNKKKK
jgi:inorganic pyrophosphatase